MLYFLWSLECTRLLLYEGVGVPLVVVVVVVVVALVVWNAEEGVARAINTTQKTKDQGMGIASRRGRMLAQSFRNHNLNI
jgi:cell envelope opacity-associated protein A